MKKFIALLLTLALFASLLAIPAMAEDPTPLIFQASV